MWEYDNDGKLHFVTYDIPIEEGEEEMIMICGKGCKHEFQDQKHGIGRRVFNLTLKKSGDKRVYRCTVCKHEQTEK